MSDYVEKPQTGWYMRPVFHVADLTRSLHFYIDVLGFWKKWHEADGKGVVCQVNRGDTEVILWEHKARTDKARLFIELNPAEHAQLRGEITERSIPHRITRWGYECIQIDDPDGNELLFPIDE